MQLATRGKRLIIGGAVAALVAGACTAGATPTPTGAFKLHMQLTPSHVSVQIAKDKGYFKGIDIETQLVGYGESSQLFHAGTDPIGNESAWEAATYQEQGKDIRFFGTAEATNFIAGIIIRTADKAKYPDLKSLKGQKIGMPGFGTGTWAAFQTIAKAQFGLDALKDFQPVEGNPGDLEGLLQTKSIEGFISFSAPTAHAISNSAYTMLYNITDEWKKANGAYLTINGWIAEAKWLDEHLEVAKSFIAGAQKGLEDLKKDPAIAHKGTKYEQWTTNEGRLVSPETLALTDKWIKDSYFYLDASVYNKAWTESVYKFIQQGQGVLVKTVPTIDKVFYDKTFQ